MAGETNVRHFFVMANKRGSKDFVVVVVVVILLSGTFSFLAFQNCFIALNVENLQYHIILV